MLQSIYSLLFSAQLRLNFELFRLQNTLLQATTSRYFISCQRFQEKIVPL
jgi:hypothetical protein